MQNELYHHGIDGQKWGVRHGPPYPLDREDHNRVIEKSHEASGKRNISYNKSRKYAKAMTDKDLNDTIDRLQREETYRRLVSKEKEEKKASKAMKKLKKEEKKIYDDRQKQQKIQNELSKEQQAQNKKANSITNKVVTALLVNAATVAGKKLSEYFIDKNINNKPDDNSDDKPNENTKPKTSNTDAMKKQQKEVERLQKEIEKQKKKIKTGYLDSHKETPELTLPNVNTNIELPKDVSSMSESEINQKLIDAYNGVYWSDESAGVSL